MLHLERLEVDGFGPFAEPQTIVFPRGSGVTVVYGENMRGKTSLLNAIRYAFFGRVLGRGSRERRLHTISNRERAAQGKYGFSVALTFNHDGDQYELVRECAPSVAMPSSDDDYIQSVLLRRASAALGPQERDKVLNIIFPAEISRFFLFDGELLQEYEELLINESEAGHRISEAIERILGVPVLKRGRGHLTQLADEADKIAAKEASRRQETQALGTALQQATEQKEAHQKELGRLQAQLVQLQKERGEVEQALQSVQKYASILQDRDDTAARLEKAEEDERASRGSLQRSMASAWRSLLRTPVITARAVAYEDAKREVDEFVMSLRRKGVDAGHCEVCDQEISPETRKALRATLPLGPEKQEGFGGGISEAMSRLAALNRIVEADNTGEVRELWGQH